MNCTFAFFRFLFCSLYAHCARWETRQHHFVCTGFFGVTLIALQDFQRSWSEYSEEVPTGKKVSYARALDFLKQTAQGLHGVTWDVKKAEGVLDEVAPEEGEGFTEHEFAHVVATAATNYFGGGLQLSRSMR
jgi:hypothetical protein